MKPLRPLLQIACVLLSGGVGYCQDPPDAQVASRMGVYLKPFAETGNLSGTVLVARKGRVVFRHSYGMANYELQVPNSPETRFHIASVSKPFTGAAILQLQEQRRLSVADPVSRFLPEFPNGGRMTLDNLLTHTSGIPDINDAADYDVFARSPHTLPELVARFAHLPLEFEPGSESRYSNSNDVLLALILERVTGESYEGYLRKHIFDPAGMRDSGVDGDASRLIPAAASGYVPAGLSGYEKAPYVDWSNKTGSGSLYSTADDLYRFHRALETETLLKSATRQKYFVDGPEDNRYGWYMFERRGHRLMAAKGQGSGFTAELDRYPDDDVTIILLTNSSETASQGPVAGDLAAIVFGQEASPPPLRPVAIPASALASYAGRYQYGPDYFLPNASLTLTANPGFLDMKIGDHHSPVVPVSHTEFLERYYFGHIAFTTDPSGNVTGLTCRYGSKTFTARRLQTN